jgi:hypothetical protein
VIPEISTRESISKEPVNVETPDTLKFVKIPLFDVTVLANKVLVLKFSETYELPNTVKVSVGTVVPPIATEFW